MALEHTDAAPLEGYPEPYAQMLGTLEDGTREWLGELGEDFDLPPEAMTWRAWPDGPSLGCQMLHLVGVEVFWLQAFPAERQFTEGERGLYLWDDIDVDKPHWPEAPAQPFSWYLNLLREARAKTLEAAKSWPEPEHVFTGKWRSCTMRWVVGHEIQHESYHGGQIIFLNELRKNSQPEA